MLVSVIEHLPSPPAAQAARIPDLLDSSPGHESIDPRIASAMTKSTKSADEPMVAYVSKMVAIPESELPKNKRRAGMMTAEEARELGRRKRAEIAKAQAAAAGEDASMSSLTDALATTAIGEDDATPGRNGTGEEEKQEDPEHLIGFARLYSGTLRVGDSVWVLGPKFSPASPHAKPEPQQVTITALYLLMGRSLEPLDVVPAGSVVGIAGLEGAILKSGTLCSQLEGAPNLSSSMAISTNAPIVRVAVEPAWPGDLDKMVRGLKMLEMADPAVLYEQLESGEHVILTAGELHLERCLKDLRERFAKCDVQAGEVIVPYREGIVSQAEMNPPRDPALGRGRVEGVTSSKQVSVRLRVRPLPESVTQFLVKHAGAIKRLYSEKKAQEEGKVVGEDADGQANEQDGEPGRIEDAADLSTGQDLSMSDFKKQLEEAFAEAKSEKEIWQDVVDKITAFGPRRTGPNLLIDASPNGICGKL